MQPSRKVRAGWYSHPEALQKDSRGVRKKCKYMIDSFQCAMLTAMNDLRRTKKSIFFLATNRLRAFDGAITRPGRFDMQLFVGTPNLEARFIQFRQKLADVSLSSTTKEEAMETYENFLWDVWKVDARFMIYAEGVKFAGACANVIAKEAT